MKDTAFEILNEGLSVVEGVIEEICEKNIWVKTSNGLSVSIYLDNGNDSFRVGHNLKAVVCGKDKGLKFIKGINKDTETKVQVIDKLEKVPNFILGSLSMLAQINQVALLLALVPLVNFLGGLFLGVLALNLGNKIKNVLSYIVIGFIVFCVTFLFGLAGGAVFTLMSPTVGVIVGYGLIARQVVKDNNELNVEVDKLLNI